MSQYKGKPNDQCFKGGSCGILENRLFVLPDGKVTLCEQLYWHPQFILGDLKEQTLAEIWQSPRANGVFVESTVGRQIVVVDRQMSGAARERESESSRRNDFSE